MCGMGLKDVSGILCELDKDHVSFIERELCVLVNRANLTLRLWQEYGGRIPDGSDAASSYYELRETFAAVFDRIRQLEAYLRVVQHQVDGMKR